MAKNGFRLIDAEMHVMEPADLWQRYIDPEFADRAPRRLDERRWDIRTLVEGEVMAALPGGDWPALSDAEEKALGQPLRRGDRPQFRPRKPGARRWKGGARRRGPVPDLGDVCHRVYPHGRPFCGGGVPRL